MTNLGTNLGTNLADVLTVLAAVGGLTVFLIMAAAPLMLDRHRPSPPVRPRVTVPAQRAGSPAGLVGRGVPATHLSLPHHP